MPHRNPLDLGCAYGETPRDIVSKDQGNKGQIRNRALRGRGLQTVQGSQDRDCRQGQEALDSGLQFAVRETPSRYCGGRSDHALKVIEVTVFERERPLVHVTNRVLGRVVGVRCPSRHSG